MSNDSRFVLSQLTRTGIWSSWCNLLQHKHLVLEADSVITFLYQQCLRKHLKRQRTLQPKASRGQANVTDYYAATLVNFRELAESFEQLLDFFAHNAIKLIVVYRGKHMEAPLFGLGPAQFKKNTQRASEPLIALIDYENSLHQNSGGGGGGTRHHEHRNTLDRMRPTRPNLALNLFKQLVASRNNSRKQAALNSRSSQATSGIGGGGGGGGSKQIECHQAFYCPYPLCARLARDFKCPVMTNDGDFVVMDVRAGFILFEEFFSSQLMASSNFVLRQQSAASVSSVASTSTMARNQLTIGARSTGPSRHDAARSPSMAPLASTRDLFQMGLHSKRTVGKSLRLRFHFHRQFLIQHPGLNPALALQLFPLTSGEFLLKYAKSLVRLRIYEREYQEQDLIITSAQQTSFKKYHMAAARLERVMRYLCAKDQEVVPNLMRGEASRLTGSPIEQDYRELYNYYAISYNFRGRLATILRSTADDLLPVAHIEHVLVDRECSADFWLGLCCAALGKLASVDYNKSIQFEDLATKHSAHAMLDRPKRLLMNVLSREAKTGKSLQAASMSTSQRKELAQRFPAGSLTVIDRQARKLLERVIETTIDDKQHEAQLKRLKTSLSINDIAKANTVISSAIHSNDSTSSMALTSAFKSNAVSLINLIFKSRDMTKLSSLEMRNASGQTCDSIKWLASSAQIHHRLKTQLAILLTLHRFSIDQALNDDQYFKQNYPDLSQHFEMGLIYSQLCSRLSSSELEQIINTNDRHNSVRNELKQAVDLINRLDLENVANYKGLAARVQSSQPSGGATESSGSVVGLSKRMRHLIELLDDSIEAYCEVNAFLNYPLAQLQLQYYNPILLFNMIALSLLGKAMPPKPRPIAKLADTFETVSKQASKKAKK